eukprot:5011827-Pyramimonas_sp.AAC.1
MIADVKLDISSSCGEDHGRANWPDPQSSREITLAYCRAMAASELHGLIKLGGAEVGREHC